jgi:ATP-dependent Clp protease protease subunit
MRRPSWFNLTRNSAEEGTIDIVDHIGWGGVTASSFIDQLRAMGQMQRITLNIDCPGGDCEDGFTIYDAIRATKAQVTAHIIGTAASMASVIMLAADKIHIRDNGRVMVHRVTAGGMGNADDLDAVARITRQFEDRIVSLYIARTKKDEATVRDWMKASLGTWFFGQEAVDQGFADEVIPGAKARAFKPEWASMFTMLPSALFDTSLTPNPATDPSPADLMKLTAEQTNRLHALLRKTDLSEAEKTELTGLQDQAKKAGYDAATAIAEEDRITASFEARFTASVSAAVAKEIKPLTDELATIKKDFSEFRDKAEKGIFFGSAAAPPVPGAGAPKPPGDDADALRAELRNEHDPKKRGEIVKKLAALRAA